MKRVLALTLATALTSGCGYNRIQTLDEEVSGYQAQIEVQLQRRADLVPNLVQTVKGFAQQELAIFEEVSQARAALGGAIQGGSMAEMAAANQMLTGALGRLIAIAEDNPEIQSNENFRMLQDQLEGTGNRIATAPASMSRWAFWWIVSVISPFLSPIMVHTLYPSVKSC